MIFVDIMQAFKFEFQKLRIFKILNFHPCNYPLLSPNALNVWHDESVYEKFECAYFERLWCWDSWEGIGGNMSVKWWCISHLSIQSHLKGTQKNHLAEGSKIQRKGFIQHGTKLF